MKKYLRHEEVERSWCSSSQQCFLQHHWLRRWKNNIQCLWRLRRSFRPWFRRDQRVSFRSSRGRGSFRGRLLIRYWSDLRLYMWRFSFHYWRRWIFLRIRFQLLCWILRLKRLNEQLWQRCHDICRILGWWSRLWLGKIQLYREFLREFRLYVL